MAGLVFLVSLVSVTSTESTRSIIESMEGDYPRIGFDPIDRKNKT